MLNAQIRHTQLDVFARLLARARVIACHVTPWFASASCAKRLLHTLQAQSVAQANPALKYPFHDSDREWFFPLGRKIHASCGQDVNSFHLPWFSIERLSVDERPIRSQLDADGCFHRHFLEQRPIRNQLRSLTGAFVDAGKDRTNRNSSRC